MDNDLPPQKPEQEAQPQETPHIHTKSSLKILFLYFCGGLLLSIAAGYLISLFLTKEPSNTYDSSSFGLLQSQFEQVKEELHFLREHYAEIMQKQSADEKPDKYLKHLEEQYKVLENKFDTLKLSLRKDNSGSEQSSEVLDYLKNISSENTHIQETHKLVLAFMLLKEIKEKINTGLLYLDEFKALKNLDLPLPGLYEELALQLTKEFPTLNQIKNTFKALQKEKETIQKIEVQENIVKNYLGQWIKITQTKETPPKENEQLYKDILDAIQQKNISYALELAQNLPDKTSENYQQGIKFMQIYLEGLALQDHLDQWSRQLFKKLMKDDQA